ncbi:hypothetical protein OAZ20_07055, partial [Paracoccaceae bacterium]|nr:hypothetical protein [Paracoccaceae bacterium]
SAPYYIEVVGEYDPAVTTNITSTAITDANVGLEMQTLLQTAGEAVLYGDDHSSETPAINGGGITTGQTIEGTAANSVTTESENSNVVEEAIDTSAPILTDFDIKTTNVSLGEEIKIEFKATDQTYVGFLNVTFSHENNSSSKINIKAQNTENTDKISDHFDFLLNSSNFYELNIPLIIEGELKSGNYNLESLSLSDANTNTNPVLNNETIYNSGQLDNQNAEFFEHLESENKTLIISIPVLDDNLVLSEINEVESNARLDLANQVLPDNIIKGDVWPTGEDWFKFNLTEPGTIIAQMDIGTGSADLKLYGPDETEIISKRVSEVGMVHHTTSDLGEYYLLIGDGSVNRLDYELILDII